MGMGKRSYVGGTIPVSRDPSQLTVIDFSDIDSLIRQEIRTLTKGLRSSNIDSKLYVYREVNAILYDIRNEMDMMSNYKHDIGIFMEGGLNVSEATNLFSKISSIVSSRLNSQLSTMDIPKDIITSCIWVGPYSIVLTIEKPTNKNFYKDLEPNHESDFVKKRNTDVSMDY